MAKEIKITLVGDQSGCYYDLDQSFSCKTAFFISYTEGKWPTTYVPSVFDNYEATIIVNDEDVKVALWDTTGQEEISTSVRSLSYPRNDVFLMRFSVIHSHSFDSILKRWYPEVSSDASIYR